VSGITLSFSSELSYDSSSSYESLLLAKTPIYSSTADILSSSQHDSSSTISTVGKKVRLSFKFDFLRGGVDYASVSVG
jgi:hypothetical protein